MPHSGLALVVAVAGVATFPLARRRDHRYHPDDARRHRAGRFDPVRRQRYASSRSSWTTLTAAAPSASWCRSSTSSSPPWPRCSFSAASPQDRPTLGLAAAGFVCYAISDFVYARPLQRAGHLHLRHGHRPGLDRRLCADRAGHVQPGKRGDPRRRASRRAVAGGRHGGDVQPVPGRGGAQPDQADLRPTSARPRPCCGWWCCSRSWPGRSC